MTTTIGSILKQNRKAQKLTQKTVATGICSQAMLSAIEHDKYIPNVALTLALCRRLGLSLETLSLAENYAISQTADLNAKLDRLCNAHEYEALLAFLQSPTTSAAIATAAQTEAYYYYLSIAEYQTHHQSALMHIQLALAQHSAGTPLTVLDRLSFATKAVIEATAGQKTADRDFSTAFEELETTAYAPNLNSLFYLHAYTAYKAGDYLHVPTNCRQGSILQLHTALIICWPTITTYLHLLHKSSRMLTRNVKQVSERRFLKSFFGIRFSTTSKISAFLFL